MVGLEQFSDPFVLELNRLQNQLKEKDRELGDAKGEIKALRAAEVLKEKAVQELVDELKKLDEKLRVYESHVEKKNLEIKKLINEKKEALASQYAAEATVRRVHANQKDGDSFPIEAIIAPLEADIKMYRHEVASLQEEKKALERLTKSKEAALLEAEKILRSALERALVVEEIQNENFELQRQIEICQEENKILNKTNCQKVFEVKKLSQTIMELEEAILAGGAAANTIRDYRRQISELQDEKRTLDRELERYKVSVNRVASVVANEWKDENDKVMPVKQWLDERRLIQAEIQRLKDKLAISERRANSEAQLKDKLKLRLKTLEEGLKNASYFSHSPNAVSGAEKTGKSNNFAKTLSSNERTRSLSQLRASNISRNSQKPDVGNETNHGTVETKRGNSLKAKYGFGEVLVRKSLWETRNKAIDGKENVENIVMNVKLKEKETTVLGNLEIKEAGNVESHDDDDMVSGFLYDKLQKEVITLRKSCEKKESYLNARDEEIKMLVKKVDTLIKALEVESKKMKRETATRIKNSITDKVDDNNSFTSKNSTKRALK